MNRSRGLTGWIAAGLVILTTVLWTFWGVMEMYYEGWWAPLPFPLIYLAPAAICLLLTLAAITWPRLGGWLLLAGGGAFTIWWWSGAARAGQLTLRGALSMFPISGILVLIGALFLHEAGARQRRLAAGWEPSAQWGRRHLRILLALGFPLLVIVGASIYWLPRLLTRLDDGDRGARLIAGNGVTLVWAPEGPGWGRGSDPQHPFGASLPGEILSWNALARYGVPPVGLGDKPGDVDATTSDMSVAGLCRYLDTAGFTLRDEPQNIWRMPTTEELVRSLVRHGENAGCVWDGSAERATCAVEPDKETPLWAPDWSPIYYWSADAYDPREAYYVGYTGAVSHQPKSWGNPRHGYRCVREP